MNNIDSSIDKIDLIIDKLVNHSGCLFEIIYDNKLPARYVICRERFQRHE